MSNHTNVDGNGHVVIVDSTVTINKHSEITNKITELREEIQNEVGSLQDRQESLDIVDAVEREINSDAPKASVLKPLIEALPSAGSIASIGSFLLAALLG